MSRLKSRSVRSTSTLCIHIVCVDVNGVAEETFSISFFLPVPLFVGNTMSFDLQIEFKSSIVAMRSLDKNLVKMLMMLVPI